jgi:hypothetical protein
MRHVIFLLIALNCAYFTWQILANTSDVEVAYTLPAPAPNVRQLVMLREQVKHERRPSSVETRRIEDLTATEPPGAVAALSCQALGPILAESELKPLEQRLGEDGLDAKPQTRYVQEQVGYTVLLSARDYDEALRIKQTLEKDDFTANIIGVDNEISLGAFRSKAEAEQTFARADGRGLAPRLEPSYAKRSTYWLVFPKRDKTDAKLAALTKKYPELRVETLPCP